MVYIMNKTIITDNAHFNLTICAYNTSLWDLSIIGIYRKIKKGRAAGIEYIVVLWFDWNLNAISARLFYQIL